MTFQYDAVGPRHEVLSPLKSVQEVLAEAGEEIGNVLLDSYFSAQIPPCLLMLPLLFLPSELSKVGIVLALKFVALTAH